MTRDEFDSAYAEWSHWTVAELRTFGLRPVPCHCEEPSCHGWQMLSEESIAAEVDLGHMTPKEAK